MAGMDEVGRLFNAQRADRGRGAAVGRGHEGRGRPSRAVHGEDDRSRKGKIILATVKGDVHDIGKNLVEIILSNNGYEVINLGIKVPPEELVEAYKEHQPDAIGLSGLLVKSAQQMVMTAQDLKTAGIDGPILVGGAALSNKFTATASRPSTRARVYAEDAMRGLALRTGSSPADDARAATSRGVRETPGGDRRRGAVEPEADPSHQAGPAQHRVLDPSSRPAPTELHVLARLDLDASCRTSTRRCSTRSTSAAGKLRTPQRRATRRAELGRVSERVQGGGLAHSRGRCTSSSAPYATATPSSSPARRRRGPLRLRPRQAKASGSASPTSSPARDARPDGLGRVPRHHGRRRRPRSAPRMKEQGDYLMCHVLQVLASRAPRRSAEVLHQKIREMWGFPDPAETTMQDLFKATYRGMRYRSAIPPVPASTTRRRSSASSTSERSASS